MGYFAFKSLLPDIAPDRLDQYISQFSDTGTMPGSILKKGIGNQGDFDRAGRQNMDSWAVQSTEFTTAWTKGQQLCLLQTQLRREETTNGRDYS